MSMPDSRTVAVTGVANATARPDRCPEAVRARLATPIEAGSESLSIKVIATYQLVAGSA
jgi:hypothetical protein